MHDIGEYPRAAIDDKYRTMQAHNIREVISGINRFPVLIISTARSGSTLLFDQLASAFPHHYAFNEPDEESKNHFDKFLEVQKTSKQYITKIHSDILFTPWEGKVNLYPQYIKDYFQNSPEVYRIRIRRKSQLLQIASLYIARYRNIWRYTADEHVGPELLDNIEISIEKVKLCIRIVHYSYQTYNWYKDVDCDVFYEYIT